MLKKKESLKLGISTCPNDTFIYQALIEGEVKLSRDFEVAYADVQTLNEKVLAGELDIAKISCATYPLVKDSYFLLKSGGAAGFGCGPLLLSSLAPSFNPQEEVYLPGKNTTAAMLFEFWAGKEQAAGEGNNLNYVIPNKGLSTEAQQKIKPTEVEKKTQNDTQLKFMRFDYLYRQLCEKKITQGVTIHEHRFTYEKDGLFLVADLGEFWEKETRSPIPLGCSVVKKELGEEFAKEVDFCIQKSLKLAWERKEPITDFIRSLAQIDDDEVILKHIKMFVNEYSYENNSIL